MATDTQFLEREYNAHASIPDHPKIFASWAEQGAAARRLHACETDLQYGSLEEERLDIFRAHNSTAPIFVFIHGGYWRSLDKSDFSCVARVAGSEYSEDWLQVHQSVGQRRPNTSMTARAGRLRERRNPRTDNGKRLPLA